MTDPDLRAQLQRMVAPLDLDRAFAKGWRLVEVDKQGRVWTLRLSHRAESEPLVVELHPVGSGPAFAQTNHFDVRHPGSALSGRARDGIRAITHALHRNGL